MVEFQLLERRGWRELRNAHRRRFAAAGGQRHRRGDGAEHARSGAGVLPAASVALLEAPAASNCSTISGLLRWAAWCRAVRPAKRSRESVSSGLAPPLNAALRSFAITACRCTHQRRHAFVHAWAGDHGYARHRRRVSISGAGGAVQFGKPDPMVTARTGSRRPAKTTLRSARKTTGSCACCACDGAVCGSGSVSAIPISASATGPCRLLKSAPILV